MKSELEQLPGPEEPVAPDSSGQGWEEPPLAERDGLPRPYRPEGRVHFRYPDELKFHITLEALRERVPQARLSAAYGVPQSLISIWKQAGVQAIHDKIHCKKRKRREALGLPEDPMMEDDKLSLGPADAVQQFCRLLRSTARQLERDPAALEELVKQGSLD